MSDIFREVDEALQREKAAKFWADNGPTIILAAIVLIASTAFTTAYRTWDKWRDEAETHKLVTAQNADDLAAAYEEVAKETRKGHEALALLTAGHAAAEAKDFAKAAELYTQAAEDSKNPDNLRDLAAILSVRAVQMRDAGQEIDYKALADKLAPVIKNNKSAFQLQAKMEAAVLHGDGLKDYKTALDLLSAFEDDKVSGSLKEKADALKHVYEFENAKTPKA
jgi:hypothetical protein